MNRTSQIRELSTWSLEAMAEAVSLAAARKRKGLIGPTPSDLAWVEAVLRAVGLPDLPTPEAYLESGKGTRRVELIWPSPRVRVLLAPPLGLDWWPVGLRAWRLRRVLLRAYPDERAG